MGKRYFLLNAVIVQHSVTERLNSFTATAIGSTTETTGDEWKLQWWKSQTFLGSSRQQSKGQATEIVV